MSTPILVFVNFVNAAIRKSGTISDWMVNKIPMTKLPCRNGVARDLIFAKANPAASDKKITASVDTMV